MEDDTLSLKELLSIDLTKVPEQESLQILDNNFPCCYIIRIGDSLEITLEEHIYTKYWFHKYHASVFAEAMIKAVKRLATEGFPYFSEELDNDDDVHLFVRWALAESIHIPNQTLIDNIELSFNKVYERANNMLENSDSILILGKDTGESMELLKRIQTYLDNKGFYTYIIKYYRIFICFDNCLVKVVYCLVFNKLWECLLEAERAGALENRSDYRVLLSVWRLKEESY